VRSVAVVTMDGKPVIVSGGEDARVRVWDLASGTPLGEPLLHSGEVYSVAVGTLEGRPVVVSGGLYAGVRVWDLLSGTPRSAPLSKDSCLTVAVGTLDGQPVIVSSIRSDLYVWDLASGTRRGEPLRGHEGPVMSIAVGMLQGASFVVSGGFDGTVRLWDARGGAFAKVHIESTVTGLALERPDTLVVAATRGLLVLRFSSEVIDSAHRGSSV
jgi:WD40 repeat protein